MLTILILVVSAEKSFSKQKIIKIYSRSTISKQN